jgi:D-alanyl-D-alanine dipeptidase
MAKKPGPVAGSLGNTEYYYKSDGTIVDEAGVPASARISAMFGPPPVVEAGAKAITPKKLKKNNAQLAGVFSDTKYFYTPDGAVVDENGVPAPEKFAKMFPPHEKREAIAAAMPAAPGKTKRVSTTSPGIPSKVIKEFNKNIAISTNLISDNQKISQAYPKMFEQIGNVVTKMTEQNETVIRSMIENNQVFQDKVLETLTGVKAPTQGAGAAGPSIGNRFGRRAGRAGRTTAVLARAKRIRAASTARKTKIGMGIGFAAGAIAGVVNANLSAPPAAPSGSPGGGGPEGAAPPGGMWPNTPASGSNKQILETIKKRESGGDYNIRSKSSSASGAYQFIDSTWRSRAQAAGVDVRQYPRAFMAPPDVQDKVADVYISEVLRQNNNDVSKIPLVWYTGNAQGRMSAGALAVNRGLTPQAYQASWMKTYQQMGGSVAASQQTTPTAPSAPAPVSVPTSGAPTTAIAATKPPTGTPARTTPSATPEETAQYDANNKELADIIALEKRKGRSLGAEKEARKKELQTAMFAFRQKISIRPMQEAGTVRPLDTTGMPSQEKVQKDLASLGNTDLQRFNTKDASHVAGLQTDFASRLGQFLSAAEQAGTPIKIMSGYRSPERQAQLYQAAIAKYGSEAAARKWVAPPGRSNHNKGSAVDLSFTSDAARAWAHQNAAKFGLNFRMSHEPWHIEPQGAGEDSGTQYAGGPSGAIPGAAPGGQMASMSQGYAMNRVAAACECAPPVMINRTITNDITRIINQGRGPQFDPAYMVGAAVGSLIRKLF